MSTARRFAIIFAMIGVSGVVIYQFEPLPAGAVMTGGIFLLAALMWFLFPNDDY